MGSDSVVSDSVDPLQGLNGPSLFPRTIRASTTGPIPSDYKDLDSIHQFMKSLKEVRSPEKLRNEAKRIMDGAALLASDFANISESMSFDVTLPAKGMDKKKAQERRQGLAIERKRARFSLKPNASKPSVTLEPTLNFDKLEDPDKFFDAYERLENAHKEIRKHLGDCTNSLTEYNPSTNARPRRSGILGKSYSYKHRYSNLPSEDGDALMSSQEIAKQDFPDVLKHDSQQKAIDPSSSPITNLLEVEFPGSKAEAEDKVNNILFELLSCDDEDLDGDGALNLLQERLQIKPLDRAKFCTELHHVGWIDAIAMGDNLQKHCNSSPIIDNLLKSVHGQLPSEHEKVAQDPINDGAPPTSPTSPVGSVSFSKERQRDSISSLNQSEPASVSPAQLQQINRLHDQIELKDSSMSSKLKSSALEKPPSELEQVAQGPIDHGVSPTSPTNSIDPVSLLKNHPRDSISSLNQSASTSVSPVQLQQVNKLHDQIVLEDANMSSKLKSCIDVEIREPTFSNLDSQKVMDRSSGSLTEPFSDENASRQSTNSDSRQDEVPDCNVEGAIGVGNSNSSDNVAVDTPSRMQQFDTERQPEARQIRKRKSNREAGENRLNKAHPPRKSLADYGTSFETGTRRSKRIRMRPLEYWKGERFLYGRVNESLKLVGVKYISPGKGDGILKVKPYIPSIDREIIEQAAGH